PSEVRAVLTRGLDPAASARWSSMEDLLDALERAGTQPARRKRLIVTLVASALLVAIGVGVFMMRAGDRSKTGCDDPDRQFVEAWSPAVRSALARKTTPANVERIGEQLDRYRDRWVESYAKACRQRPAKIARQRIACLEGIRDQAAAITTMLGDVDAKVLNVFEPRDALATVASCETASPLAPPGVPRDQPRRDKILHLIGRGFALRGVPAPQLGAAIDALLAEAKPLDWPPLAPLVLVPAGSQYVRLGETTLARATYQRALASLPRDPELRDVRLEGSAYLGLLDTSLAELENPHAAAPPGMKDPKTREAPLHGELTVRITKATNAAGGDPLLLGARSLLAALAYAHAAQWNRYPTGYDEALRLITEARKQFDEIGDVQRSAFAAATEAEVYLMRGDDRALDDALFAARRGLDALEAAKLPRLPQLDDVRAKVAFARRDYKELYRIQQANNATEPKLASAQLIKGRVVGENAGAAIVVAWQGSLTGHAKRLVMNAHEMTGDLVRVESDGTFMIRANPDWMIMAETKGARSAPQLVGDKPPALKLEPTVTVSGQVESLNLFDVQVFARYTTAHDHAWELRAPVDKDGSFDLGGLPPGPHVYGTHGPAGTGERTIIAGANPKQITWSYGQAIEIIVRAKTHFDDGARAWVIRGEHAPESAAQLEALLASAPDVATSKLYPIGADNTDAGRDTYRTGDRHAVITGNSDGVRYTVCARPTGDSKPTCIPFPFEKTVGIPYDDGRYGAGVSPILLEL
ncbi:MAG TPA: hypothetical protein VFV99_28410, partial [Kofleriaceae bacterium]|nr:hypothetical protein [Kofleriaceae bacterium]